MASALMGDDVRKYLREQPSVLTERNLPVVSNKTVEQAERELIYRALVDLKSNIIEMKELLTGRISHTSEFDGNNTQPHNGNGILTMDEMERRMISSSLNRNKGNRGLAARELNIQRADAVPKNKRFWTSMKNKKMQNRNCKTLSRMSNPGNLFFISFYFSFFVVPVGCSLFLQRWIGTASFKNNCNSCCGRCQPIW